MSSNLLTNKFFLKKFSRYLLVGISALILMVAAQQGLFEGINSASISAQEMCGQVPCPPEEEAPSCPAQACNDDVTYCDPNVGNNIHKTGGYWDSNSCSCVYAFVNTGVSCVQQPPPAPPPPGPSCPKDAVVGTVQDCVGQTFCTFNMHTREDCSQYRGGAYNCQLSAQCGYVVPQPPPPALPPVCVNPQPVSNRCVSCNLMEITLRDSCGNQSTRTESNAACSHLCQQPPRQCPPGTTMDQFGSCIFPQPPFQQCPVGTLRDDLGNCVLPQQQQQQQQPAQPVNVNVTTGNTNVTTGNTSVTTGSVSQTQSQTVNVPAQGAPVITVQPGQTVTREVIRLVSAGGNVGVGTTSAQVLGVKELPKTGLPLLAWSVLAFIPTGLRLKKLGTVTKDTEGTPNFIWEDRKFKTGA